MIGSNRRTCVRGDWDGARPTCLGLNQMNDYARERQGPGRDGNYDLADNVSARAVMRLSFVSGAHLGTGK